MVNWRKLSFLVALIIFFLAGSASWGEDWPYWRGPNRAGLTSEKSGWDGQKWALKKGWTTKLGQGSGSPIVVGDRLYALGWAEGKDTLYCLNAATGKEIWKQSYRCPAYGRTAMEDQDQYGGPSTTPEWDPHTGYLYTLSTDGDLFCWEGKNQGKKVWGFNLHDQYKIETRPRVGRSGRRDYGCTTAPLVLGDWLLVQIGAKQGTVAAFDKRTGKAHWVSELQDPAGHTGGLVPLTIEGIPCVAVLTHFHLAVLRLDKGKEGKVLAKYPWITDFANSIPTPAVEKNFVLVTSAYNNMALVKLAIRPGEAKKVWEQPVASGVCSLVIHRQGIYWSWNGLHCLDWEKGKEKWSGRNLGSPGSCLVTGDDKLIVWGGNGTLALVELAEGSPRQGKELARRERMAQTMAWPHVVLAGGRLFCKDREGNLTALQVGLE